MDRRSDDYKILLLTVSGEARGESKEGQVAVAWVLKNRANKINNSWGGNTLAGVCQHSEQVSLNSDSTLAERKKVLLYTVPHMYSLNAGPQRKEIGPTVFLEPRKSRP